MVPERSDLGGLKVSRCTRVNGSERNCPELEVDTLADRQPVQLSPQLSDTGTTWRLSDHITGERVLDTLKAVEVALGSAVEQTATVVKKILTATDLAPVVSRHASRF